MRPYEKERIHNELKVVGEFGLKNKRELWRVHYSLAKIRKAARTLLTLPETDTKRIFEGSALLHRLTKLGVLDHDKQKLDYVLSLTVNDLLDRRLQTQVHKTAQAKSVHHARSLINHRHIAVKGQLINEKMQKEYGIQVGDMIDSMQVVGVVPDYIYGSMRRSITPTALMVYGKQMIEWNGGSPENTYAYMYVKTQKGVNLDDALHIVRGELEKVDPDYPFDVRFFDDVLNQLYKNEQRLTTLITLFSLLAVFISVVGVFGLVVFDSESRRKEIGVRKVLGSTTGEILWMFNKNYLRILVVCFIIASPFAWYGVNGWLQNFAYKIPIYWWVFLIAFLLVSVVTLLTVTYQNWHAANENPVNSIKNE